MNSPSFETLPHEIQLKILRRADFKSVGQVSQVASKFRGLGQDEPLWRDKFQQISKGFDPENIPSYLAPNWLERFKLMHSLLDPKKCYTFMVIVPFEQNVHKKFGEHITIMRSFVSANNFDAVNCLGEAYNKRAEPVFSMMNALGVRNVEEFQSFWARNNYIISPYFDLNSYLVNDRYTGLTLFKFLPNTEGQYLSISSEAMLTIPGNNPSIMYELIAFLLNNSKFFLEVWGKVAQSQLFLEKEQVRPFLEILRKKTIFMKVKQNYHTGDHFIGSNIKTIFETLQDQGRITYAVVVGPLRKCFVHKTEFYYY